MTSLPVEPSQPPIRLTGLAGTIRMTSLPVEPSQPSILLTGLLGTGFALRLGERESEAANGSIDAAAARPPAEEGERVRPKPLLLSDLAMSWACSVPPASRSCGGCTLNNGAASARGGAEERVPGTFSGGGVEISQGLLAVSHRVPLRLLRLAPMILLRTFKHKLPLTCKH